MDNQKAPESIPYFVHEQEMSRQERSIKRLWILCIIIFLLFVGTNAGWMIYEDKTDKVFMHQSATTDGGGDATVRGTATGDIYEQQPDEGSITE